MTYLPGLEEIEKVKQVGVSSKQWANRIILEIPLGQMKLLKKDRAGTVVVDGQMYELKPKKTLVLKNGTKLTRSKLLALLKQL